jgi:hypothetical protein
MTEDEMPELAKCFEAICAPQGEPAGKVKDDLTETEEFNRWLKDERVHLFFLWQALEGGLK